MSDSLWGDVNRPQYIEIMRDVAGLAGRDDLIGQPQIERTGWQHTDVETGRHFDHLAGGSRAQISAITLNRVHDFVDASDDPSAVTANKALREASRTGDNYQFSSALYKAEGELKLQILDALVEHELMSGFPSGTIRWIKSAGGNAIGTEARGYNLAFFEEVWELAQLPDIGAKEHSSLAEAMLNTGNDIIADETWDTNEGQAARLRWTDRYEAAQDEIDATLIAQADVLIVEPWTAAEDHTMHALATELSSQIARRFRQEYNKRSEMPDPGCVRDLVRAHLDLRLVDAEAALNKAETSNTPRTGDVNVASVTLMYLQDVLGMDKTDDQASLSDLLTQQLISGELQAVYKAQARNFAARIQILRRTIEPVIIEAPISDSKPFKGLLSRILGKS